MTPAAASGNETEGLVRIGELADAAGVPVATVRHYLREGLLPEGTKTSRNMAYYPPELSERIKLIKQLQEERFMPLKVIKGMLERAGNDMDQIDAAVEAGNRIIEHALAGERVRTPEARVVKRTGVPAEALHKLAELGILTPNDDGYSASDIAIAEAISRFRSTGFDEEHGFTVHEVSRLIEPISRLVDEGLEMMSRLVSNVEAEEALKMVEDGAEPLRDLIAALHSKLMATELGRRGPDQTDGRA